ncbi:MAG: hypothetical protein KDM91_09485 [Verrucomicrobiae bacterium]|nr:hypothetical protein [Verrucomicrobiae bacterium]MCP5540896.1 hypothetical protein [Akkermansiaceae bacterium]
MSGKIDLDDAKGLVPRISRLPGWKKRLLVMSGLIGIGGLVGQFSEKPAAAAPVPAKATASPSMASGLVESTARESAAVGASAPAAVEESRWSGALSRFGWGFFLAFAAGALVRWFIKTALMVAAIAAILLTFLVKQGIVEPFWNEHTDLADQLAGWVKAQSQTVTAFVKGWLPSSFASATGFFLGLRR